MPTLCGTARAIGVCDVAPRDCKVRRAAVPTAEVVYVRAAPHGAMRNVRNNDTGLALRSRNDMGAPWSQQVRGTKKGPQLGPNRVMCTQLLRSFHALAAGLPCDGTILLSETGPI